MSCLPRHHPDRKQPPPSRANGQRHLPLPSPDGCGRRLKGDLGADKHAGGPRKWEAQAVRRENGQRQMSLPVFSVSFLLYLPLTTVKIRLRLPPPPSHANASRRRCFFVFFDHLPPPPPPSRPNASRGLCFSVFCHNYHHHCLPRMQTRARGGVTQGHVPSMGHSHLPRHHPDSKRPPPSRAKGRQYPPLPSPEGCGRRWTGWLGAVKHEGRPRKWEAQVGIRYEMLWQTIGSESATLIMIVGGGDDDWKT